MKTVSFGANGPQVSVVGLGGEGVLRTFGRDREAQSVIRAALELGITYFDSARAYSDSELYYGSVWSREPGLRKTVFQTSKSAARSRDEAWADLHRSLHRLHTEYLDLWQIHDLRTEEEFAAISGPGGALEAFVGAREQGLVRFIGVTGHENPEILARAVAQWPVDAVLLPANPVEGVLGGFLTLVLQKARSKGIAVIGMKALGAGHYILPNLGITPGILIRYALSCDLTLPIVGCATPEEVKTLAAAAAEPPLSGPDRSFLESRIKSFASQMAFYRGLL